MKIGFVGISHLAINYLIASASRNFYCIGFDEDKNLIKKLNKGQIPFHEPGLNLAHKKNIKLIHFSNDFSKLKSCDLVFIAKDIKTNDAGKSDLSELRKLINKSIKNLRKKTILILLCQLPTGTTRSINWDNNKLFYQVETLIFGKAFLRALKPERIIIGKSSEENKIPTNYIKYLKKFNCPIIDMNYESAELCKMSINMYLISALTTTNLLSDVANHVGAKWSDIVKSLKLDKRIGKYAYLNPGLGISGGNLERDLFNIISLQKKHKLNFNVNENIKKYSLQRRDWIEAKFKEISKQKKIKKIAMLGLAYKENTNSVKNSVALNFIKKYKNIQFSAFDPAVKEVSNSIKNITICESVYDSLLNADILIIGTPWEDFRQIEHKIIYLTTKLKIVIDPYSILNIKKSKLKIFKLSN